MKHIAPSASRYGSWATGQTGYQNKEARRSASPRARHEDHHHAVTSKTGGSIQDSEGRHRSFKWYRCCRGAKHSVPRRSRLSAAFSGSIFVSMYNDIFLCQLQPIYVHNSSKCPTFQHSDIPFPRNMHNKRANKETCLTMKATKVPPRKTYVKQYA